MKFIFFVLLMYIMTTAGFAQEPHSNMSKRPKHIQKKMEDLEKIKLIEVIQADEETMLRFFSRRKDFQYQTKKLEDSRDEKLNELSDLIENDSNSDELKKRIGEIQAIDSDLSQVRSKYITSLTEILNFKQVAKVLIFERNFREELRAMILKERKRRN